MISGFFDPDSAWPIPLVRVGVSLPSFGLSGTVTFVLDTGADDTILHPRAALARLNFSYRQLRELPDSGTAVRRRGIGGSGDFYRLEAIYLFTHDDGRDEPSIPGYILVAPLSEVSETLPSLLGWDILQRFRLTLDWQNRHIALRGPTD